jgi:hypothetical protein
MEYKMRLITSQLLYFMPEDLQEEIRRSIVSEATEAEAADFMCDWLEEERKRRKS